MSRRLLLALALTLAVLELTGLRQRFLGRKRFRFVYATTSKNTTPEAATTDPEWKLELWTNGDGDQLPFFVSQRAASGPWVFYFPGNDAAQLKIGVQFLSRVRGELPWNAVALAYRGFESTKGLGDEEAIRRDLQQQVTSWMEAKSISADQVLFVGFSIGAYFASATTAELTKHGHAPRALALLAPAYDLVMVRPSFYWKLDPGDNYDLSRFLPEIATPSLIVQGTADNAFHGPQQGRAVAETLKSEYVELEGVRHEPILEEERALLRVREFLAAHTQRPAS